MSRPSLPDGLPFSLGQRMARHAATRIDDGQSGAAVWRLEAADRPALFLKHGQDAVADAIAEEAHRLRWLRGRLAAPRSEVLVLEPNAAWLLTTACPGRSAYRVLVESPERQPEVIAALADHLRALHALPLADCPFDARPPIRLAQARRRMDAGEVDADDFDEAREGWTPQQVWAAMLELTPRRVDAVVTHGDYSLDNVLIEDGRVSGLIDVGRLGVADRWQDLAILWNNLEEFGASAQRDLLSAYGVRRPDHRRINFHLCLDEFF